MTKFIKKIAKKIMGDFFSVMPLKYIVFESVPDLSDNAKAVFDEMLKRGLNKKYIFVWICNQDATNYPKIRNVKYLSDTVEGKNYFLMMYYVTRAKCVICCNRLILSNNPKTVKVYLDHGNPLKNTSSYYRIPGDYDLINSTSAAMRDIKSVLFHLDKAKMVIWGHARNDILTQEPMDLHPFFETQYQKIVVWYPTVRQFKGNYADKRTDSTHALPVIWDEEKAIEINDYAKNKDILIVLKPHFAQDISRIKALALSNLVFIDDDFFKVNDISSYRFVGSCDALITDYSSIYYDYTLCDKPIGLTWEDYEEYARNPGFAVDMDYVMKGGYKIYTVEDFKAFLDEVAQGVDSLQAKRREIRDFANAYHDGRNAQRAVDAITKRANL